MLGELIINPIFVIHLDLGLSSPVPASSNVLFIGLPSFLRPFVLYLSIMFGIFLFLLNVVAYLICNYLVSRQLVLL